MKILNERKPSSICLCTLLDKPERREVDDVNVDYTGFQVPDEFVVGYGLDLSLIHILCEQSGISGAKRPESGGIILEEAAKVIGGVAGELVFFMRSFMLGFLMRLGYEPIIFFRRVFRQPKLLLDVQDVLFWTFGSFLMFGLLFRENNGTPRLFSPVSYTHLDVYKRQILFWFRYSCKSNHTANKHSYQNG